MRHPVSGAIHALLDSLSLGELELLDHLLGCRACRKVARLALAGRLAARPRRHAGASRSRADYSGVFAGLAARAEAAGRRVSEERAVAAELAAELDRLPPAERGERAAAEPRFASVPLGEILVDRARTAAPDDLERCFDAVETALAVADGLAGRGEEEAARGLRADAWMALGRRDRLAGDPLAALDRLRQAGAWLPFPLAAPERGTLCAELGRAYRDCGLEDEAAALLDRAATAFRDAGEEGALAEISAEAGELLAFAGDPEGSSAALDLAFSIWGTPPTPLQAVAAWSARAAADAARGALLPAEAALRRAASAFARVAVPRDRVTVAWTFAAAAIEVGALDAAESALAEICASPVARGRARLCAGLHLAALAARRERPRRLREALARIADLVAPAGLSAAEAGLLAPLREPGVERRITSEALAEAAEFLRTSQYGAGRLPPDLEAPPRPPGHSPPDTPSGPRGRPSRRRSR